MSDEVGNDKQSGQEQQDSKAARQKTASSESLNEAKVGDNGEKQSDAENSHVSSTSHRHGLEEQRYEQEWNSDSKPKTNSR